MISRENGSLRKHPLLTRKNVLLMLMMVLIGLPIAYRVSATFFTAPPPPSPPQSPELLGTFEMNIVILDATDLYAWQAMVYFNTSELEVVDVVEGDFLKANAPNGTVFTFNDDTNRPEEPTWGRLFVGGDLIGKTSGASGNGTLATITFGYKSEDYELPKLVFDDKVFDTIHVQHDLETSTGTLELEPQSQP